jgi:hypothetical protein
MLLALSGCRAAADQHAASAEEQEPTLAEQVAAAREGTSDRIQVEAIPLSDDDLGKLSDVDNVRELLLDHPQSCFTAKGLRHLVGLPKLQHLRVRGAGIDDEALAQIATLVSLQILNVPRATFADAGLEQLKHLPNLVQLRFGSPHVTNAGMKTLVELPSLKRLHLIDVPITDEGLRELARIEQLESLYIDGADLSDVAFDELFRTRPDLHVHLNQRHHDRDPRKQDHGL